MLLQNKHNRSLLVLLVTTGLGLGGLWKVIDCVEVEAIGVFTVVLLVSFCLEYTSVKVDKAPLVLARSFTLPLGSLSGDLLIALAVAFCSSSSP